MIPDLRSSRVSLAAATILAAAVLATTLARPVASAGADPQIEARRRLSLVQGEVRFEKAPGPDVMAILRPRKLPAAEATLDDREWVIGVASRDTAVAYPLRALAAHEVVNDWIDRTPIAVTWSASSASANVLVRRIGERDLTIGVTDRLWRGHRVLYDAETKSLWSQLLAECLEGELAAHRFGQMPFALVRWSDWRRAHPETAVLDPASEGGAAPAGTVEPYAGAAETRSDGRLADADAVFGVLVGRAARAYPYSVLRDVVVVEDRVGKQPIVLFFDGASGAVTAFSRNLGGLEVHFDAPGADGVIRDVGTQSRWDPVKGTATEGKMAGVSLPPFVVTPAAWRAWRDALPATEIYAPRQP